MLRVWYYYNNWVHHNMQQFTTSMTFTEIELKLTSIVFCCTQTMPSAPEDWQIHSAYFCSTAAAIGGAAAILVVRRSFNFLTSHLLPLPIWGRQTREVENPQYNGKFHAITEKSLFIWSICLRIPVPIKVKTNCLGIMIRQSFLYQVHFLHIAVD